MKFDENNFMISSEVEKLGCKKIVLCVVIVGLVEVLILIWHSLAKFDKCAVM